MKRLFTLLLTAFCLTAVGQVPDYVPTEGLVAWYGLNGDGQDGSGFGNHANVYGGTWVEDRNGGVGQAIWLDGLDDFIEVPSSPQLNFGSAQSFTVSLWWQPEATYTHSGYNGIVNKSYPTGSPQARGWQLGRTDDDSQFYAYIITGEGQDCSFFEPFTLSDFMAPQLLLLEFDRGQNEIRMSIQGQMISTMSCSGLGESLDNDHPLTLGVEREGLYYSSGHFDDLSIWNRLLSASEKAQILNDAPPGCTNAEACNYDVNAMTDDGSCDLFTCRCLPGTVWNEELGGCVSTNTADINNDGCVQLNDLLDLLSAYGDCGAEESPWHCGDLLEYQGYDYETVQIGEQCWFSENLRSENYLNGEPIPTGLDNAEWQNTSSGALAVQQSEGGTFVTDFGLLYNHFSVLDERGLCPLGWHVPFDVDFIEMEVFLGLPVEEAESTNWRGSNQGDFMKASTTDAPSWNGTNETGFSALAGGYRRGYGTYQVPNECCGYWWTADPDNAIDRALSTVESRVQRKIVDPHHGMSIRCLKNAE